MTQSLRCFAIRIFSGFQKVPLLLPAHIIFNATMVADALRLSHGFLNLILLVQAPTPCLISESSNSEERTWSSCSPAMLLLAAKAWSCMYESLKNTLRHSFRGMSSRDKTSACVRCHNMQWLNMSLCLRGDFDPSSAILGLVLPFGPKPNLVKFAGK